MNEKLVAFLIAPLALIIPLYQALANLQIALLHHETLLVIGLLFGGACLVGLLAALGGEKLRVFLLAGITIALLDVALETRALFNSLQPIIDDSALRSIFQPIKTACLLSIAGGITYLYWVLRMHIHSILFIFLTATLLATVITQPLPKVYTMARFDEPPDSVVRQWSEVGPLNSDLPIVLHIILDELISPSAIERDLPGGVETARMMYEFGETHSFRTFDSVYGRHYFSPISIPNMMNAEYRGRMERTALSTAIILEIDDNAYFDDMAARGYRIAVFQTTHLNFCANKQVALCETFDSFDPNSFDPKWSDVRDANLNARLVYVWDTLFRGYDGSYVSKYGRRIIGAIFLGGRPLGVVRIPDRFDVQAFPSWFDRFVQFVARAPRGTHILAHFMVPHAPYLLTDSCLIGGYWDTGYYLGDKFDFDRKQMEDQRRRYYSVYLAQVRCVFSKLREMMETLDESKNFVDATIIIHGDHGSRISVGNLLEHFAARDFVDNYATFFAVKGPGVEQGVDCEFVALPEVFRRYMGIKDVLTQTDGARLPVLVDTKIGDDRVVEATMQEFGCGT